MKKEEEKNNGLLKGEVKKKKFQWIVFYGYDYSNLVTPFSVLLIYISEVSTLRIFNNHSCLRI